MKINSLLKAYGSGSYGLSFWFIHGGRKRYITIRCKDRKAVAKTLWRWRAARKAARREYNSCKGSSLLRSEWRRSINRYGLRWLACRAVVIRIVGLIRGSRSFCFLPAIGDPKPENFIFNF